MKLHHIKSFFERCKDLSDWTIHDKAYYETEEDNLATLTIFTIVELQKEILKHPQSEKEREFAKKVLSDLPNTSKANFNMLDFNKGDISKISGHDIDEEENNL